MDKRRAVVRRSGLRLVAAVAVVIAGVALAALVQLRAGAGLPADVSLVGVGSAATISGPDPATALSAAPSRFRISGGVTSLYPGATRPLLLTVTNPQQFTIVVTSVTVAVGNASAACPASNLAISQFTGALTVPPQSSAALTLSATLAHSAGNACQGAVFLLTYSGTATRP